ncbi:hypothetical protein MFRU_012g01450 [Monilinia fructicola]|uniref:Uncharacterized protein n=1 Tax=Monilinia fructicola TaxID=38448 RepID=A0A5M9JLB6_MONFR|nr:hypothetical protein EYC84_007618 [Monilinia fructicola]KAG4030410.1 hypothetical protein MFRU_012g01450 [Monilinia fructicola]
MSLSMTKVPSLKGDAGVFGMINWLDVDECFEYEDTDISKQTRKEEILDTILSFCCGCIKDALRKPQGESMEALVNIWDVFMNVAQIIEWTDPFHDRLICLLLWTKEFEVLRRTIQPEEMNIRSSWECHRLVEVVHNSWKALIFAPHDTLSKQCNLASFTATAFAVGAHDWLGITALWYLHQALEISDRITVRLAPITIIWIRTAGAKLLTFSILKKNWENKSSDNGALDVASLQIPGILAQFAGVTYHGFSLERWFFWKERFECLSLDDDEETRIWARDTVGYMTQFDSMLCYGISEKAKMEGDSTLREKDKNKNLKTDGSKANKEGHGDYKIEADNNYDGQLTSTMEMATALENKRLRLLVRQKD